jgi:glutamate 5-kinase
MKKIVIKIGSSVILTGRDKLDEFRIAHIASQVASLRKKNNGVVLVISGAVVCGARYVDLLGSNLELRKVAAGIGQAYLVSILRKYFSSKNLVIAQILLTKDFFCSEANRRSLKETLDYYFQIGIIPVINENDVLDLNSFEGNDYLASEIAIMLEANQVLMLSQMTQSTYGVGGGKVKLQVVEDLKQKGIKTSIVDGKEKNIILNNII